METNNKKPDAYVLRKNGGVIDEKSLMVRDRDLTLESASRRLYDLLFMDLYGFIKPASDGPLAASKLSALEKVAIEVLKKEHQVVPVYFTYGEVLSDGEEKES